MELGVETGTVEFFMSRGERVLLVVHHRIGRKLTHLKKTPHASWGQNNFFGDIL